MAYPAINTSLANLRNTTAKKGREVKHIVVHYTGSEATAKNNCIYFANNDLNASADWFIDRDGSIWAHNADPRNNYSWHCGDGHGKYGISNAYSVGIEVVSGGSEYNEAQISSLTALVQALMADYGVPAENVVRHYDASRKSCPYPYCGSAEKDAKWKKLHARITSGAAQAQKGEPVVKIDIPKGGGTVYRLYSNGIHMYAMKAEADALAKKGWKLEGEAWKSPDTGLVVYRLAHPGNGQHMFTIDFKEADSLQKAGWVYEGASFASARSGKAVMRLYNQSSGEHFFTVNEAEAASLKKAGWKMEGTAFWAL